MGLFERSTGGDPTDPKPRLSGEQISSLFWALDLGLRTRAQIAAELTGKGFVQEDLDDLAGWFDVFEGKPSNQQQRWAEGFERLYGLAQAGVFGLRDKATFEAALALI